MGKGTGKTKQYRSRETIKNAVSGMIKNAKLEILNDARDQGVSGVVH